MMVVEKVMVKASELGGGGGGHVSHEGAEASVPSSCNSSFTIS